jgi:PilZ domain
MANSNQRDFFRIDFPLSERPELVIDDRAFAVIDCSESGLRYAVPDGESAPETGSTVHGVIRFRRGDPVEVAGVIARVYGRSAAVRFLGTDIPFSTILREQQHLRRHYLRHLGGPQGR